MDRGPGRPRVDLRHCACRDRQNTQNRDTGALQLKLDELIRANEGARNRLLQLEDLTEEEMIHIKKTFLHLAKTSPRLNEEGNGQAS